MTDLSGFPFRVGQGWDVHAMVPGRRLVLGGVEIPSERGLLGHSDADALLHAITDAVLGAAGLGDIGAHFPDTDARYQGADSSALLARALEAVRAVGWGVANVDCTVIAQTPRLGPHREQIRSRIAEICELDVSSVNFKAKTAERLGPVGLGLSIEAQAVVLIARASLSQARP